MNQFDTVIIGGGAAGLIAAGFSAKQGRSTLVIEKMPRPARKILVTGKGRCNVTNNCTEQTFIKMVKTNPRFLFSAYNQFSSQDVMELFEQLGVPLETQRGNRVFPKSLKAMDIADALVRFAKTSGAQIINDTVEDIIVGDGRVTSVLTKSGEIYSANKIVLATGGKSYPGTGSTGDGYLFAQKLGHTIKDIRPSLVPIVTKERWVADVMGLMLKNVTLTLKQAGKKKPLYSEIGELQFAHFGIMGPLALSASAYMSGDINSYTIEIDLKPGLSEEQLDVRLLRDLQEIPSEIYSNAFNKLLPRDIIPVIIKQTQIPANTKVAELTKENRAAIVKTLKSLTLNPDEFRPIEEAVITSGGVAVSEIDPKTMQSKLVEGLYFAGEVIDVDAFTGGFNLQIAFSTGAVAGKA